MKCKREELFNLYAIKPKSLSRSMPKKAVYIPLIVDIITANKAPMVVTAIHKLLLEAGHQVSEDTIRKLVYREVQKPKRAIHIAAWSATSTGGKLCFYDVGCKPNVPWTPKPKSERPRGRQRQLEMTPERRAAMDRYNERKRAARRADASLKVPASERYTRDYWPKPTTEAESQTVQQALARKAAPWLPVL